MHFLVGLIAVFAVMATLVSGLDVLTIEGRAGATVFQQMVARITFGFSALIMIVALGFTAVLSAMLARSDRVEAALKDIAASNADIALIHTAAKVAAETPTHSVEAARRAEEDEAKRARLAAYRAELQGGRSA